MFSALGESFFDGQHLVMNWRLYVSEPIFEGTAQVSCFILQLVGCAMSSKGTVDGFTSLKNETLTCKHKKSDSQPWDIPENLFF